jgi:hypothetical protein
MQIANTTFIREIGTTEMTSYYAHWSAEDEEWVGTCDYSLLSYLNKSPAKALLGIRLLREEIYEELDKLES